MSRPQHAAGGLSAVIRDASSREQHYCEEKDREGGMEACATSQISDAVHTRGEDDTHQVGTYADINLPHDQVININDNCQVAVTHWSIVVAILKRSIRKTRALIQNLADCLCNWSSYRSDSSVITEEGRKGICSCSLTNKLHHMLHPSNQVLKQWPAKRCHESPHSQKLGPSWLRRGSSLVMSGQLYVNRHRGRACHKRHKSFATSVTGCAQDCRSCTEHSTVNNIQALPLS